MNKNRKNPIRVGQKTSTKASKSWNQILWTEETKINLCQNDGGEKSGEGNKHS